VNIFRGLGPLVATMSYGRDQALRPRPKLAIPKSPPFPSWGGWGLGRWGYDHNGLIARPEGAPRVGMVDKAGPISLSGLGHAQNGLGRDQSGLDRDQSGLGRDQSNHGHNLANCSCDHESNNQTTRKLVSFLVTGYRLIGLWCGTIPEIATTQQPWSSITLLGSRCHSVVLASRSLVACTQLFYYFRKYISIR
jgi:hypothetical protein